MLIVIVIFKYAWAFTIQAVSNEIKNIDLIDVIDF